MTICIGMMASDGLVIAADAQESDQYYKRSQQKILPFYVGLQLGSSPTLPSTACAFTGAGEAGYIDAFYDGVIRNFPQQESSQPELENYFAGQLKQFHEQHLFPLAVAENPPEIQILIGAYVSWQTCMFVSHGSTLRRAFPHAAVGLGAHFALSLIEELNDVRQDLKHNEVLAAYIVAMTKERIEGCGNYTAMFSFHNSKMIDVPGESSRLVAPPQLLTHVPGKKIREWEESFGTKWAPRQMKLIEELIEEELADDATQVAAPEPLPEAPAQLQKPSQ